MMEQTRVLPNTKSELNESNLNALKPKIAIRGQTQQSNWLFLSLLEGSVGYV